MVLPIALQVIISGLVAVVVADLIATGASARRLVEQDQRPERRIRSYAFHAFVLVAILPVLLLAAVNGQLSAAKQESDGAARLHEAVTALSEHVAGYVTDHERGIQTLSAALAAQAGPRDHEALLERYHRVYPGFVTIFAADPGGAVRDIYPRRETNTPAIGDREYFRQALSTRALAVSDVIVGRLSHVTIVTFAVPFFDARGNIQGVAGGSLDLSRFDRFLEGFRTLPGVHITVVDQHDRVIYTSGAGDFTTLQNLATDPLVASSAKTRDGVFRYPRTLPEGGESPRLAAVAVVAPTGWKVFVEQPLVTLRLQSYGYYGSTLALMLLALAGAVLGAQAFSSAVTHPLEEVVAVVRNISAHGVPGGIQGDVEPADRNRLATGGRERHAGPARRLVSTARTGAGSTRAAQLGTARADRATRSKSARTHRRARGGDARG